MDTNALSARLFDLAHLGRVVAKLDYGISSKRSKPTDDDWKAGLSSDPQRDSGSWPALIQESNDVLPLYLATINSAVDDLPNAPELPRYDHNGEPWKPVCHRLLSKLASVNNNVQAFVGWGRLPNEWAAWLREIEEIATVLEGYEANATTNGADDDTAYVTAITIWKGRFTKYEDFRKWLANHPEIPTKPKGKQRLLVHAAKCLEALAKQDKAAFDRLDDTERPEVIPDNVDDATYLGNVESLYRDVFASKKPQK